MKVFQESEVLKKIKVRLEKEMKMNLSYQKEMCNLIVENENNRFEYNFSLGKNMSGITIYLSYFEKSSQNTNLAKAKEIAYVITEEIYQEKEKEYAVIAFAPSENLVDCSLIKKIGFDEVFEYAYGKKYFFKVKDEAKKAKKQIKDLLGNLDVVVMDDIFFVKRLMSDSSYMPLMDGNNLRVKFRYEGYQFELGMKNINGNIVVTIYKTATEILKKVELENENLCLEVELKKYLKEMYLKNLLNPPVKEMKNLLRRRIYAIDEILPDENYKKHVELYKKIELFLKETEDDGENISVLNFLEKVIKNEDCEINWQVKETVSVLHSSDGNRVKDELREVEVCLRKGNCENKFQLIVDKK